MRDYETLTPGGQVRRLRPAIAEALAGYGLDGAPTSVLQHAENTVLRVDAPGLDRDPRYLPDRLVLRIHGPDYQSPASVAGEVAWLAALTGDGLPVPAPVPDAAGRLVPTVAAPDALGPRPVTMLRWLRGRRMHRPPPPDRYRAVGALLARLHDHAERWRPATTLSRHRWDWEGFFGSTIPFAGTVAAECWGMVPEPHRSRWWRAADRFRAVVEALGEGPEVFGLIHADAHYGNLLYHQGEMRPVDFDDCGWGWYLYDFAVGLGSPQRRGPRWAEVQEAFWDGYRRHRPVPVDTLRHLDDFFAARAISVSLWEFGMTRINPEFERYAEESLDYVAGLLDVMGR